jgi:hypothetical protein
MAITYTWKVTGLKTSSVQGTDNVIVQTYWEKIGKENGVEGKFSGATPFDPAAMPAGTTFTPFERLTEDTVLEWIKAVVVGNYEEHVNGEILRQINEKRNPVVDATLPWAPATNTANTN